MASMLIYSDFWDFSHIESEEKSFLNYWSKGYKSVLRFAKFGIGIWGPDMAVNCDFPKQTSKQSCTHYVDTNSKKFTHVIGQDCDYLFKFICSELKKSLVNILILCILYKAFSMPRIQFFFRIGF